MKNQYHLISFLLFLLCVGVRLASVIAGASTALMIIFYIALAVGIVFLALDSFGKKKYASAFIFKNRFHLNVFSALCCAGFFVDFVSGAVNVYQTLAGSLYIARAPFVSMCVSTVMALLSSFYFVLVSSSFANSNYDFRKLRALHFAPLLWGLFRLFAILDEVPNLLQSDAPVLKHIVLIFITCAFFFFAFEVDSTDGTKNSTVFVLRAQYYVGTIYFVNQLMLLLGGENGLSVFDCTFAVTVLLVSGFMYFCEKNIIYHTRLEV